VLRCSVSLLRALCGAAPRCAVLRCVASLFRAAPRCAALIRSARGHFKPPRLRHDTAYDVLKIRGIMPVG